MKKFVSVSLADLSQDIAGQVPVDLVQNWVESEATEEQAANILGGYKIRGTLVSSDTSGLSKLSTEKDLLEVLKIVSDPKEIVYGIGRAIGGRGTGKWVADNTQMFFPETIALPKIVNAIFEVNKRIENECEVKLGFCIHYGEFLNIGNGFYGEQADFMEEIAENHADGGEILITETVANSIEKHDGFEIIEKKLQIEPPEKVFILKAAKGMDKIEITERDYPIYFDQNFFNRLKRLGDSENVRDEIYRDYSKNKVVVLIQKKSNVEESGFIGLLDLLLENTVFSAILKKLNKKFGALEIKIAGSFAIFAFEINEIEKSIEFAKKAREELEKDFLKSISGIDAGEVLLFPLEDGTWDIAGGAVNVASKQAQDIGEPGYIYVTAKTVGDLKIPGSTPYRKEISRIVLEGLRF